MKLKSSIFVILYYLLFKQYLGLQAKELQVSNLLTSPIHQSCLGLHKTFQKLLLNSLFKLSFMIILIPPNFNFILIFNYDFNQIQDFFHQLYKMNFIRKD